MNTTTAGTTGRGAAALLITILALTLAGPPGTARAAPPRPTSELTAEDVDSWLDGILPVLLEQEAIPGATISVVANGEVLTERGYGFADTGHGDAEQRPVDPQQTLFRVGSISKVPVATAVMQLVENGALDLDAPVADYLDFELATAYDTPVTMRHLLSHTAGFEDVYRGMALPPGAEIPPLREYLTTQMPEQIFPPGTMPAYSNYGYTLAAYVVQRASGTDLATSLQTEVLDPAGMDTATFAQPLPADLAEHAALPYPASHRPPADPVVLGPWPAGSLSATASDMSAFMLAHLAAQDSPLLAPETLEQMHAPALGEDALGNLANGPQMTLGFFEENRNGHRILGHSGDLQHSHAAFRILPDDGVGIFLGLNGSGVNGPASSLAVRTAVLDGFVDRYFPASGEQPEQPEPTDTASEHAQAVAGTYLSSRRAESTFAGVLGMLPVRLSADGDTLVGPVRDASGHPVPLIEVDPWVFQAVDGSDRLAVRVAEDGTVEAVGASPAVVVEPAPAWLLPVLATFAVSLAVLLITVVSWPVRALVGRRLRAPLELAPRDRRLRRLAMVAALLAPVTVGLWAVTLQATSPALGLPVGPLARAAQVATLLTILGVVPAAWRAIRTWGQRRWLLAILATLVALAFAGFGVFALASGLLLPDLSF